MLYKVIVCLLGLVMTQQSIAALPPCHFVHYSTEDGLPQHTIMDMLQDKDGLMWFVTWDGLCRFDGYHFTSYKINRNDPYLMKSNRIDHIREDKYGYLWLQSYDGELHRFDPRTHSFRGLQSVEGIGNFAFLSSSIVLTPSGKTWLLSRTTGCICIADSSFATRVYNYENGLLKGKGVIDVFEDKQLNSWLLTDNGLAFIPHGADTPDFYFAEKYDAKSSSRQSFHCAKELDGKIWFGSNNGRIWQYDQQKGSFDLFETHSNSGITDIRELPGDRLLIVSSRDGFFILDQHSGKLAHFNAKTLPEMKSNRILSCYADNHDNLWIESDLLGVSKFDLKTHTLKRFEMPLEGVNPEIFPPKFFLFEDAGKRLWVHPKGGGFSLYNPEKDVLEPFCNDPQSSGKRFSNVLHSAYPDRQGNLWLCTRSHGLEKVVFETQAFEFSRLDPNQRSETANDVRALFEDKEGRIWISTKDGKLRVFDSDDKLLGIVTSSGQIGSGAPLKGVVYALTQDNRGNIWLGARGEGVYVLEPVKGGKGLSFRISQYKNNPGDVYSISENSVYSIFQDSHGNIWTGTYGGGLNLAEQLPDGGYRFINHRNKLKTYPLENGHRIRYITEDKRGNICVGTTLGLIMFKSKLSAPDNIRYRYYARIPGDETSLGNNDVHFIKPTSGGEMYIATFGGGINRATAYDAEGYPLRFKSYTRQEGLPADVTLSIAEDRGGGLWITTENNLTRFNPSTESFETFGEIKRQMHTNNFSEAAALYTKEGKLYLGHSHGLLSFFPEKIKKNAFKPYITLDKFLLFNKEVPVGNKSTLTMNIDKLKEIKLKHNQNFFGIGYAALDYVDPQNIAYAYKLDGIDNDWVYAQQQRVANYTNIPKGEYTFRVRSSNSDGIWMDNERSLRIVVEPSFWETPWAYGLYGLLFVVALFISVRILFIIYRLKDKVEMEQQLAEMKLDFFTDISHEIRTPLTMVTAPLEFLLHNEKTPKEMRYHLELIETNARRMLRLVNQILDFNKIQRHKMCVEPVEIAAFISDICDNFRKSAEGQDIRFRFVNEAGSQILHTDKDYMEKIVFNLLSNAFKYTPGGKSVAVRLFADGKQVSVEVADEGKGISREKQKMLFKRFASFNEDKSKPSTGIGLSIVKELADKLNAQISVESEPGKGSVFTVHFPTGQPVSEQKQDKKTEQEATAEACSEETDLPSEEGGRKEERPKAPPSQPTVLVVEDDDDLRQFLHAMLKDDYAVVEACDGASGLKIARQILPDFIVSDIMMPEMDGIELLQQLKGHIATSHIPVALLTAKTTIESKLTGLEFGADDYITKPFSVPYFKARIANLLKQRRRLHELYANHSGMTGLNFEPDKPAITPQDESFMKKVMTEIENNISNGEFLIEELSNTLGVSRTVFFKKIKSITGLAPVEFVRDIRLKRAAQLLDSGQFSIKEVSYMTGISDPAYFRKCFKRQFGKTPAEYRNKGS